MTWPVNAPGSSGSGVPWMVPFVDSGTWRNCGCGGGCSCNARCEITMGVPVVGVTEVTIDGVILAPAAYRVDYVQGRGPVLVRTDGECWPECQDMNVGPDDVGAFTVTYQYGKPVPRSGQIAAGRLACEFAKACVGGDCVLPNELSSLTRNGVEVSVVDPAALPESILTGIAEVDRWVRSVNPANLRYRPRVLSPDVRTHRITP